MKQVNQSPRHFALGMVLALQAIAGGAQAAEEGVRFSRIDVRGNTQSSDAEILALCQLSPTARYQANDLRMALDCLGQSGRFETVNFDAEGDVLVVNVLEAPQYNGLLDVSASVDSDRGLSGNLFVEKRTLFSEELTGSLSVELSKYDTYLGAFLQDEDMFGSGIPGGFNLEYSGQNYPDSAYDVSQFELGSYLEFAHGENALTRLRAGVQRLEVDDVAPTAGAYMQGEENTSSRLFLGADYQQRREFALGNLENASLQFSASQMFYANSGGGNASKTEASAAVRAATQGERFAFGASVSGGHVAALGGGRTSIADRFQLGGESLRGFAERSIGPRENGHALGGNSYAVMRVEGDMRLMSFENIELRGGLLPRPAAFGGLVMRLQPSMMMRI